VVVKDASANKGGVTSSSMEVLGALAMDDESFLKDMCVDEKVEKKTKKQKKFKFTFFGFRAPFQSFAGCMWKR
jgi:glutamate dehydrogenase